MTINLDTALASRLAALAEAGGTSPEEFVLDLLRKRILPRVWLSEPRDEFERLLRRVGRPCGVAPTDDDLSRDAIYG